MTRSPLAYFVTAGAGFLLGNLEDKGEASYQAALAVAGTAFIALVVLHVALHWHRVFGPRLGEGLTLVKHGGLPPNEQGMPGWFVWAKAERDLGTHFLVVADGAIRLALGGSERPAEDYGQFSVPRATTRVTRSILRFPDRVTEGSNLGIEVFAPGEVRITSVKPCKPEGEPYLFRPSTGPIPVTRLEDPPPTESGS